MLGEDGKEQQTVDEDLGLIPADAKGREQAEMAFPGFEKDLDAPAKAIEFGGLLRGKLGATGIGEQNVPVQEVKGGFGGVQAPVAVGTSFATALGGELFGQRKSQKAGRDFAIFANENGDIEETLGREDGSKLKRLTGVGIVKGNA